MHPIAQAPATGFVDYFGVPMREGKPIEPDLGARKLRMRCLVVQCCALLDAPVIH